MPPINIDLSCPLEQEHYKVLKKLVWSVRRVTVKWSGSNYGGLPLPDGPVSDKCLRVCHSGDVTRGFNAGFVLRGPKADWVYERDWLVTLFLMIDVDLYSNLLYT